jgi:hypothetical protein
MKGRLQEDHGVEGQEGILPAARIPRIARAIMISTKVKPLGCLFFVSTMGLSEY